MTARPSPTSALSDAGALLPLDVGLYRFTFEASTDLLLPSYPGSAWRGAFGHALKRTVCTTHLARCDDCLLLSGCAYPYLFETRAMAASAVVADQDRAPCPYVLAPHSPGRARVSSGEEVVLDLTLIGRAVGHLPFVVQALTLAGQRGIGADRGRLSLRRGVAMDEPEREGEAVVFDGKRLFPRHGTRPEPPSAPPSVTVEFVTPQRLKAGGALVTPERFTPAAFLSALVRRVANLAALHGDHALDADFKHLKSLWTSAGMSDAALRWKDWTRFSSRQDAAMQMGGLVGTWQLDMSGLEPLWPYLWLGRWVHAGKGATMGLGRYRLTMPS